MITRCSSLLCVAQTPLNALLSRSFAVVGRKSKNVAAKKNKHDALRTKLFQRLGVKILMAAKKGGAEPDKNIELARALKEAYSVSLPKENIERALKKATEVNTSANVDGHSCCRQETHPRPTQRSSVASGHRHERRAVKRPAEAPSTGVLTWSLRVVLPLSCSNRPKR